MTLSCEAQRTERTFLQNWIFFYDFIIYCQFFSKGLEKLHTRVIYTNLIFKRFIPKRLLGATETVHTHKSLLISSHFAVRCCMEFAFNFSITFFMSLVRYKNCVMHFTTKLWRNGKSPVSLRPGRHSLSIVPSQFLL